MATNDLTSVARILKEVKTALATLQNTPGIDLTPYLKTADADTKYLAAASKNTILASAKSDAASQVQAAIKTLVGVAPKTLDTLGEIATAIGNDANLQKTINDAIANKADASALKAHIDNTAVHLSAAQVTAIAAAAKDADLKKHITDTVAHITAAERTNWNAKVDRAALTGATTITDEAAKTWVDTEVASLNA